MTAMAQQFMTITETAALVRLSESGLRRRIAAGKFPEPLKIGSRSVWDRSEVVKHLEQQGGDGAK